MSSIASDRLLVTEPTVDAPGHAARHLGDGPKTTERRVAGAA